MKAVAVLPRVKNSARVIEMAAPTRNPTEVRVRVLRVGIDGTDIEIDRAEYGEGPPGEDHLVIGHESLGRVDTVGTKVEGFAPGDHVVAMVRRPDDCHPCRSGEPDMCLEGEYTERGIKGRYGFLSEYYVEVPEYLVKLPAQLADVGVLLEPLTIVEKGLRHAWRMQERMRSWEPRKALVLGAGPIGLLGALLLRLKGLDTFVYARDPDAGIATRLSEIGASYVAKRDRSGATVNHLADLPVRFGPFDFILEATGAPSVAIGAMRIIGLDGVLCLASVTGGESPMEICASCLNLELVLGNRVIFGTVNANRVDFENGVRELAESAARWPGWLDRLITRRVPFERFREAFERGPGDLKVVVEV